MQFKGTKGNWNITDKADTFQSSEKDILISDELDGNGNRTTVARISYLQDGVNNHTAKLRKDANGRLIASSLDLLNAIIPFVDYPEEDLQAWIDYGQPITITVLPKHLENALTAIKKAIG